MESTESSSGSSALRIAAADKFNRPHRLEHAAAAIPKALLPLLDSADSIVPLD